MGKLGDISRNIPSHEDEPAETANERKAENSSATPPDFVCHLLLKERWGGGGLPQEQGLLDTVAAVAMLRNLIRSPYVKFISRFYLILFILFLFCLFVCCCFCFVVVVVVFGGYSLVELAKRSHCSAFLRNLFRSPYVKIAS